jgi:hypothetical protein
LKELLDYEYRMFAKIKQMSRHFSEKEEKFKRQIGKIN